MEESSNQLSNDNIVAIAAIAVTGFVCICCIAAFAGIMMVFFSNPPW